MKPCTKHEDCREHPELGAACMASGKGGHVAKKDVRITTRSYGTQVRLYCGRCRAEFDMGESVSFAMARAVMQAFEAEHEDCEPYVAPRMPERSHPEPLESPKPRDEDALAEAGI